MATVSVRLPNSVHVLLRELAKREGVTISHLISSAVAEKMSALATEDYLQSRAKRGNRAKFEAALRTVPDVEPEEFDRLPEPKSK